MMINFKDIVNNPHRDLNIYPVSAAQVAALEQSIQETGFWDNLLVRPHPYSPGQYQLAYGHHRLIAASNCGITQGDIPCRPLSDDDMLHIMIKENATQAGGQSSAATEDSVQAVLRRLSYLILSNDYETFGTIVPNVFANSMSFCKAKGLLIQGNGLGHPVIFSYDGAISERAIKAAIGSLKDNGSVKRILEETLARIEEERIEAERIEAQLIEAERLEHEKQRVADRLAEEQRAAREVDREASISRLAKLRKDKDAVRAAAESERQKRLAREIEIERVRTQKREEAQREAAAVSENRRAVAAAAAAEMVQREKDAQRAADLSPVQTLGDGLSKYFANTHQSDVFRKALQTEGALRFISMDQHENIAKELTRIVEDSEARHSEWLASNEGVKKRDRTGEPLIVRLTADLIRSFVGDIVNRALGVQSSQSAADASMDEDERKKELGRGRVQLSNYVRGVEAAIKSFDNHINGIQSVLRRRPELAESVSVASLQVAACEARKQIDRFEQTINELDLSVNT